MKSIVFSAKARADLVPIADLIATDDPTQASRFVAALHSRCVSPALHPFQGRPAPEIGEGTRLLIFRSYVTLPRVVDERIEVVRILHGAQDRAPVARDP